MFHLTQILVPLIVGDDSSGEGRLRDIVRQLIIPELASASPCSPPLVPPPCAAWPQLCGRQLLCGQRAQLQPGPLSCGFL